MHMPRVVEQIQTNTRKSQVESDKEDSPLAQPRRQGGNDENRHGRDALNHLITNPALNIDFKTEMTSRLDFLKFVIKISDCKILKNSMINLLWECLVVNGFSLEERDQFFIFCTEILTYMQVQAFAKSRQHLV